MMIRKPLVILVAIVLVAAACGDDDSPGGATGPEQSEVTDQRVGVDAVVPLPLLDTTDALIEAFGPDGAFGVLVQALDLGYSVEQIAEAAGNGAMTSGGVIPGVEPEFFALELSTATAFGLVEVLGAPLSLLAVQVPRTSVQELKRKALSDASLIFLGVVEPIEIGDDGEEAPLDRDQSRAIVGTLLMLSAAGYSMEQIVEGLVSGTDASIVVTVVDGPDGLTNAICPVLAEGGNVVAPARSGLSVAGVGHCAQYYDRLTDRSDTSPTTAPASADTTTSPAPSAGADIVAFGPFPVSESFGTVVFNEYRAEACNDGRLFITARIEVDGEAGRTFLSVEGQGTWDPEAGVGEATVINTSGLVGGESDAGAPFPMSAVVDEGSITIDVADDPQEPLPLPIHVDAVSVNC